MFVEYLQAKILEEIPQSRRNTKSDISRTCFRGRKSKSQPSWPQSKTTQLQQPLMFEYMHRVLHHHTAAS